MVIKINNMTLTRGGKLVNAKKSEKGVAKFTPPLGKKVEACDIPRSGFLPDHTGLFNKDTAIGRAFRQEVLGFLKAPIVSGGKGMVLTHDYPFRETPIINISRPAVARFMFSDEVDDPEDNNSVYKGRADVVRRRYYGSGSGSGSVATNENCRIIRPWTTTMAALALVIKDMMRAAGGQWEFLARHGAADFNLCAVLVYQDHNDLGLHSDQVFFPDGKFRQEKNSQRENSAVAIVTFGKHRRLAFKRRFAKCDGTWALPEKEAFMELHLGDMSVFILHPKDEKPQRRRDMHGRMKHKLQFMHMVLQPLMEDRKDYVSVAYCFRVVVPYAYVNVADDKIMVDDRSVPGLGSNPAVQKRVVKRNILYNKGMNNPNSKENITIRQTQEKLHKAIVVNGMDKL